MSAGLRSCHALLVADETYAVSYCGR
jgi:hypothetical protein